MAFIGPRPDGMEACHNDGNYNNNHISNLRWDTRASNCQDRLKHGHYKKGSGVPASKLTEMEAEQIRILYAQGESSISLSKKYNISQHGIYVIVKGNGWKHAKGPITKEKLKRSYNSDKYGEKSPTSILKSNDIIEILRLIDCNTKLSAIASMFSISGPTVSAIKNKRIWRRFQDELANQSI